jgi:hypothetical protein
MELWFLFVPLQPFRRELHQRKQRATLATLQELALVKTAIVAASVVMLSGHSGRAAISHTLGMSASTDTSATFAWTGTVTKGGWLRIRDLAGSVEVRRASGNTIEVHAAREPDSDKWWWNHNVIQPVKFVTQRQGSDVVICATAKNKSDCDANDLSSPDHDWNDDWHPQPMHVVVELPAGVSLQAGTMHGDVTIADASAEVVARTGHGNISARGIGGTLTANTGHGDVYVSDAAARVKATTGHGNVHVSSASIVQASTGHGDVDVRLGQGAASGSNDMLFESGHGNVTVVAPKSLSGDVDLHSGHGSVSSDFPLTVSERDRHERSGSAHGTVGSGGRSVRLSTGHGDVSLNTTG